MESLGSVGWSVGSKIKASWYSLLEQLEKPLVGSKALFGLLPLEIGS